MSALIKVLIISTSGLFGIILKTVDVAWLLPSEHVLVYYLDIVALNGGWLS